MKLLPIILVPISFLLVVFLLSNQAAPIVYAQPTGWVELVEERTRNGKAFFDPSRLGVRAVDVSVAKVHYDGPDWKDIDNTLIPSLSNVPTLGLVDLEMITDDYEFYALQTLNTIPLWLYRNKSVPDTYVTFNPQALRWTNDLDQIDQISMPQSVIGTVTDNRLHWENAYGPGINLTLSAQSGRLVKALNLEAMPPEPAQYILDGGNPVLELQFIFGIPSGPNAPEILVDMEIWGQSARTETVSAIEFIKNGETIFSFAKPAAFDSGFGIANTSFILTKQGPNLRVAIRVPLEFLQDAVYPVVIDPTIDERTGASLDDGWSNPVPSFIDTATTMSVGIFSSQPRSIWSRFASVGIDQGTTIDIAHITVEASGTGNDGAGTRTNIFFEDEDNAVSPTTQPEHAADVRTTAFTAWDNENFVINVPTNSPSIVSVVQEVVNRVGWLSNNAMMLLWDNDASDASKVYEIHTYDGNPDDAILLHIEFSLWTNTTPSITNKITTEETTLNIAYSRSFSATDPDTNQTLQWELNTTDAPFTIRVVNGQNRTTFVNATPNILGTFFINVTVGDNATTGNATDFVNYTLVVAEPLVPIPTTVIERALFFLVGFIPFIMAIGIGFWKEQGALVIIGGIIGILLGLWVIVAIYFVFGFMFVGLGILFSYIGWVNIEGIT